MTNLSELFGDSGSKTRKPEQLSDLFGEVKAKGTVNLDSLFGTKGSVKPNHTPKASAAVDKGGDEVPPKDTQALDALFEGETPDVHFCRDCAHYMYHPFGSRCCLKNVPAEPLGDCEQFSPKSSDDAKDIKK